MHAGAAAVTSHVTSHPGVTSLGAEPHFHTRESSYDSYEKESVDSFEDTDGGSMPMTRYNSGSALNRNRDHQNFHTVDSSFSDDRYSSQYRSSPDLSHSGPSHRRYSSTDSVDDSHHSGHSRQGSDSTEGYSTRRMSAQYGRKSSVSADPLQFVKGKGATELAQVAQVQMRVAAESKKANIVNRAKEDDNADWQANLSTWKDRRKSQSERSYALKEELEQMEKEKSRTTESAMPAKTYSQMQEERERRKSLPNRRFYPIEDDEDDAFAPSLPTKHETSTQRSNDSSKSKPWSTESEEDDDEEDDRESDEDKSSSSIRTKEFSKSKDENDNNSVNNNNNKNNNNTNTNTNNNSNSNHRNEIRSEDEIERPSRSISSARSRLSQKFREMDSEDTETSYNTRLSQDSTNTRSRRSGVHGYAESDSTNNNGADSGGGRSAFSRPSNSFGGRNAAKISSFNSRANDSSVDKTDSVGGGVSKVSTGSVGPRTQNKIGSIMKNFEQSEAKTTLPKQGYNEKIDISSRKKSFERFSEEPANSSVFSNSRSEARKSRNHDGGQAVDDSLSVNNHSKDFAISSRPLSSSKTAVVSPAPTLSSGLPVSSSSSSSVYASAKVSGKDFVEKTIKISQKPNNDKGFGFIFSGGMDKDSPLTVTKVSLGSGADICDLKTNDKILSVNQVDVSGMTTPEVGDLVAKAVQTGNIELRVRRELGDDDFDEEEDFTSSSEEGEEDVSSPGYRAQTNTTDAQLKAEQDWLEQQIADSTSMREEVQDNPPEHQPPVSTAPEQLPWTESGHQVETESRQVITLRPQEERPDSTSPTNIKHSPSSSVPLEEDSDGSGFGPPAILRKWQRQRHKEEYTFDNGTSADSESPLYNKMSLNTSLSHGESGTNEGYTGGQSFLVQPQSRPWDQRMDDWTTKQDQDRQPYEKTQVNEGMDFSEAKFMENKERMKQKYEEDLRAAEDKEDERKKQEQTMLQPEMDKARLLEERRAERQARIQKGATAATTAATTAKSTSLPVPADSDSSAPDGSEANFSQTKTHVTSMMFNITPQPDQLTQVQGTNALSDGRAMVFPPTHPSVIMIDPRNRQTESNSITPVEFQVSLGPKAIPDLSTSALLEAEREKIRQEELQKIENERKKTEEERILREEEMRKIREKEQLLQQQEEKLRLQQEQFLKEQEEFRKLKELQLQQQQQQQQLQQNLPQTLYPQDTQAPLMKSSENRYELPQANRDGSPNSMFAPVPFNPQKIERVSHEPSRFLAQQPVIRSNNTQAAPTLNSTSPTPSRGYPYASTSASSDYRPQHENQMQQQLHQQQLQQQQYYMPQQKQQHPPHQNIDAHGADHSNINSSSLASWPPKDNTNDQDPRGGRRFSREEMLAMNRHATPMQMLPNSSQNNTQVAPNQSSVPITREAPSRGQIISLNSAPKAKLKDDAEWYGSRSSRSPRASSSPRQQQNQPHQPEQRKLDQQRHQPPWETHKDKGYGKMTFAGPEDHWLVQEAERRRMAESESRLSTNKNVNRGPSPSSQFSGPIKPAGDSSNRWRDKNGYGADLDQANYRGRPSASMPAAIRQTLLQKTAGARGNGYPHDPPPPVPPPSSTPSFPHPNNYHNQDPQQHQQQSLSPNNLQHLSHQHHQHHQLQQLNPNSSSSSSLPRNFQQQLPPARPAPPVGGENGAAVNGSQLCSHCEEELGFGAAMVIESLGLYYHVQCFRCCVCHASLGTGVQGADVRVRANKLHCPDCYSNDEAGLKFSKV